MLSTTSRSNLDEGSQVQPVALKLDPGSKTSEMAQVRITPRTWRT